MKKLAWAVPPLVFLAFLWPLRGGFTDDGFIHIQYARNIALRGEYSFNAGEVSFGTTSPLWVMGQAFLALLFGSGEELIVTSRVVSWMSGFLSLLAVFLLTRKLLGSAMLGWLAALSLAADAWLVRWTAMSMETSSAVLAVLAASFFSLEARWEKRSAFLLGFFLAVGSLLRPESYLLFFVYLAVLLFGQKGRVDSRCALATAFTFLALLLPWLLFARLHIGSFLPNTAGAKSGGLVTDPITMARKLKPVAQIVGSTHGLLVLVALAELLRYRAMSRLLQPPFRFLSVWAVALPLAYVVFDIQILSRYLLLMTPLLTVLGLASADHLASGGGPGRKALPASVALLTMVASGAFYCTVVLGPSRSFSSDLTTKLRGLALYLNEHSRPDAVVAAADIGYLAFYSGRRVLDLGGLVEPATGRLREECSYEEIVERGLYLQLPQYPRVDYFVDRERVANRFDGRVIAGYRFESVLVREIANLGIRKPGPFFYTLYRLYRSGHG